MSGDVYVDLNHVRIGKDYYWINNKGDRVHIGIAGPKTLNKAIGKFQITFDPQDVTKLKRTFTYYDAPNKPNMFFTQSGGGKRTRKMRRKMKLRRTYRR